MNAVLSTMLSHDLRYVDDSGNRQCTESPPSQGNAQTSRPKCCLFRSTTGTAPGQFAIDHDRRDAPHAKALRPFSDLTLLHIKYRDVARRTRNTLNELDRVFATPAPGTEDFNFSLVVHSSRFL